MMQHSVSHTYCRDGDWHQEFADNIGGIVYVDEYGEGILRFYGPHKVRQL